MTYEIPQTLQYKERIIFNLTLEQLLYAAFFGFIAFLLYAKTPFSLAVRVVLALCPVAIGFLCVFCNLTGKATDFWAWWRFRHATIFDKSMKHYLTLSSVEKGCYGIQNKNGERRVAILQVEPLNFRIKTTDEQQSIIAAFQRFLNALDFPVQLVMYTDDLNLGTYLDDLAARTKKTGKAMAQRLFTAHKQYLDTIMKERLAVNRKFLIAIPENEMGLDSQLKIIMDLLNGMNLKHVRLGGRQLIRILIRFFNNPRGRTELLKHQKTLYNIIAPEEITNRSNHIKVNEHYNRVITAVGYPRTVEEGFLDKIITAAGNFDLSIHIEPFPLETTLITLNRELQKQRADLYASQLKQSFQPSLEIQYNDTRSVLDSIQRGEEKLFNVSLYINIKSKDTHELDILTRSIKSQLNSILIIPRTARLRMAQGLKSVLPFGTNELAIRRNITTHALSAFFPFTSPFLILEKGGVFLGLNKNKLPIIKDIFSLANANGAILATSGSGKSYTAKLIISRYLMNGTKIIVIDPQSEYTKLTEAYGGKVITISRDSDTIINPLDLLNHTYTEKRLALLDFFQIIFGDLSELQKAILDRAVSQTYAESGITESNYWKKVPPTLRDLYAQLELMEKKATGFAKATYSTLLNRLSMYVDGVFSFLNNQTRIDLNNQFITFNLGSMPKQVKPAMMFLILDYVYTQMKHDRERKLLIIDEAWSLLSRAHDEGYIFEIVKTCRKFNLGLLLITQDVADLVDSKAGRAVLANSSYTILLRQKNSIMASLEAVFNLSHTEREHLITANVGEGVLMMENDHQEIKIIASPEEHKLITTKPDELILMEHGQTADLPIDAKRLIKEIYPLKDVYKVSSLHVVQREYLEKLRSPKYTEHSLKHPYASNHALYLVRERPTEGADHVAMAWWWHDELLNYTDTAERIYTNKEEVNPDVRFVNQKKETIVIEVETGSNYKFNKDYLQSKIKFLNKMYPSRWCIVLTNNTYLRRYQHLCDASIYLRGHLRHFLKQQFPSGIQLPPLNTTGLHQTQNTDDRKDEYDGGQKKYAGKNKPTKPS